MKASKLFAVAALVFTAVQASAIVRPGWERPIASAPLAGQVATWPRATTLTMNKRDGVRARATSFTLVEDTGIRCVTTPCPSMKMTAFQVSNIQENRDGSVDFTAIESVVLPPGVVGPMARVLSVRDTTRSLLQVPKGWQVRIQHYGMQTNYFGVPSGVATIQSALPSESDAPESERE